MAKVPVLMPEDLTQAGFIKTLRDAQPDLLIVATYDKLIPREIIDIPKQGAINVHSSYLPAYRGACPEFWAMRNGERETGVTIHFLSDVYDTGDIISQEKIPIDTDETVGMLLYKIASGASKLLITLLLNLKKGAALTGTPQDETRASNAPMTQPTDLQIDWQQPSQTIFNLVRASNPVGGAWTSFRGYQMKVWHALIPHAESIPEEYQSVSKPGTVIPHPATKQLFIRTGDGFLDLKVLQPALYYTVDGWSFKEKALVKRGEVLE